MEKRLERLILFEKDNIRMEAFEYLKELGFPEHYDIPETYYSGSIYDYIDVLHYIRYHYDDYLDKEKMLLYWIEKLPKDFVERLEGWFSRKLIKMNSRIK